MIDIRNYFAPQIGPPGLSIIVENGILLIGGTGTMVPQTTVALIANATNFVYLNTSTAAIVANTSGFPASNCYPIATVVASNSGVSSLTDNRPDIGASGGGGTWDEIGNAAANLALANGAFTTTFDQTSNVPWLWANTTAATALTTNASPLLELGANYWTGSASAQDTWTFGSSLAAGTNGVPTLSLTHSGSTGVAALSCNALTYTFSPSAGGNTTFNLANGGSTAALKSTGAISVTTAGTGSLQLSGAGFGILFQQNGTNAVIMNGSNFSGIPTFVYGWSSSTTPTSIDTGLSRLAAGSIAVGNGTSGNTSGTLIAGTLIEGTTLSPTSAATAGATGQIAWDSGKVYVCTAGGIAGAATWKAVVLSAV